MRRRALLSTAASTAIAGLAFGTAGCLAGPVRGSRELASGEVVTLDGVDFEVGDLRLQTTFVEQGQPFWHWDAQANPRGRFAVLPLAPTGGESSNAADAVRNATVRTEFDGGEASTGALVNESDQDGYRLAASVPDRDTVQDGAVVLENGGPVRYPLTDAHLDVLADPPRYSTALDVPAETGGATVPVEFVLTNDGSNPGTVAWTTTHGVIADAWWTHRTTVPAGETVRATHVHDTRVGDGSYDSIYVDVDYGIGDEDFEVAVVDD
ncbi:hypothetical protein [Halorubellus sp. PRR65]|uniref:hypothetical protein n=1 Tax=Halorubellus sp. PRR65 TaxID=3098148 RepID=UPI002B25E21A|nr:hypothetical protein [Halorubellus sp. PRR65]